MKKEEIPRKPIEASTFDALKKIAYEAAIAGKECGYNDEWKNRYVECYTIDSLLFLFERVLTVYKGFIQGEINLQEGKKSFQELEGKFNRINLLWGRD